METSSVSTIAVGNTASLQIGVFFTDFYNYDFVNVR